MIGYFVGLIGMWVLQDSLASIAFYPAENWKWNHTVRIARGIMGAILMVLGGILLGSN